MGAEEAGYVVALRYAAEGASGCNDADAGVGGELGVDLVPVVADVVPGLDAGVGVLQEDGEENPAVLIANLTGDGVVESARDEGGLLGSGRG